MTDPVKDDGLERPVPEVWRPTLAAIVDSLARRDAVLGAGLPAVDPVSPETSQACLQAIHDYGDVTLTSLRQDSWETSVAVWFGDHWRCLVDLWAKEEGRSDLVLDVHVFEHAAAGYRFHVHLVYVP